MFYRISISLVLGLLILSGYVFASSDGATPLPEYRSDTPSSTVTQSVVSDVTFSILNTYFARGPDGIYVVNEERDDWIHFPEADSKTFEVIAGRFARDKNALYHLSSIIEGVDRGSFVVVSAEHGYAGDDDRMYGPHGVMVDADPDTFRMLNKNYSLDISRVFFQGFPMSQADAGSFEILNDNYAMDDTHVYYQGNTVSGAHPEGFEILGLYSAMDANGTKYFEGKNESRLPNEVSDIFTDPSDTRETPFSPDSRSSETDTIEESTEAQEGLQKFITWLTGKDVPIDTIHLIYIGLFLILGGVVLIMLYMIFSRRMGQDVSLLRSFFNIFGSLLVALLIFALIKSITGVTGMYSSTILFFVIAFLVLLLSGMSTFANVIRNVLVTSLVIFIGAVLCLMILFTITSVFDTTNLLNALRNPIIATDTILLMGSVLLCSIIYRATTQQGWIRSILRSLIAVLVSIFVVVIIQRFFDVSGIYASMIWFHLFLFIVLVLLDLRITSNVIVHIAHMIRITIINFAIMMLVFMILRGWGII